MPKSAQEKARDFFLLRGNKPLFDHLCETYASSIPKIVAEAKKQAVARTKQVAVETLKQASQTAPVQSSSASSVNVSPTSKISTEAKKYKPSLLDETFLIIFKEAFTTIPASAPAETKNWNALTIETAASLLKLKGLTDKENEYLQAWNEYWNPPKTSFLDGAISTLKTVFDASASPPPSTLDTPIAVDLSTTKHIEIKKSIRGMASIAPPDNIGAQGQSTPTNVLTPVFPLPDKPEASSAGSATPPSDTKTVEQKPEVDGPNPVREESKTPIPLIPENKSEKSKEKTSEFTPSEEAKSEEKQPKKSLTEEEQKEFLIEENKLVINCLVKSTEQAKTELDAAQKINNVLWKGIPLLTMPDFSFIDNLIKSIICFLFKEAKQKYENIEKIKIAQINLTNMIGMLKGALQQNANSNMSISIYTGSINTYLSNAFEINSTDRQKSKLASDFLDEVNKMWESIIVPQSDQSTSTQIQQQSSFGSTSTSKAQEQVNLELYNPQQILKNMRAAFNELLGDTTLTNSNSTWGRILQSFNIDSLSVNQLHDHLKQLSQSSQELPQESSQNLSGSGPSPPPAVISQLSQ